MTTRAGPHAVPADYLRIERAGGGFSARTFDFAWGGAFGGDLLARAALVALAEGLDFPAPAFDSSLAPPESLPSDVELARAEGWPESHLCGIEWRRIRPRRWPFPPLDPAKPEPWSGWFRPRAPLPDDPALHTALLVFASDLMSHTGVERRLGDAFRPGCLTSLDHAFWIHQPRAWDDWWLIETSCEIGHAGRALTRREISARDGTSIATVMQEQLVATV